MIGRSSKKTFKGEVAKRATNLSVVDDFFLFFVFFKKNVTLYIRCYVLQ